MKKIIALFIGLFALFTVAGCSLPNDYQSIISSVSFPDTYMITYEIENEDNTITTLTKGKDANGNYYYKSDLSECVFIFNESNYRVNKKVDDEWVQESVVNQKYVEDATNGIDSYIKKSMEKFNGRYSKDNTVQFLERTGIVYTLDLTVVNFKQTYEMIVDEATGICLSYRGTSSVSGMQTKTTGFECVLFDTEVGDFTELLKQVSA